MHTFSDIFLLKEQMMIDRVFFRTEELSMCETQEERDKLQNRWAILDSAEEISDAIRSSSMSRSRFLGIF